MEKEQLEHYKELLLKKRHELLEQFGIIKDTSFKDTRKDSSGENSSYTFHMADQGTDSQEREKAFLLAYREGRLVYHIDEALDRIDNGIYGKCHECGESIDPDRLEAVPHARLCFKCKSKEETAK